MHRKSPTVSYMGNSSSPVASSNELLGSLRCGSDHAIGQGLAELPGCGTNPAFHQLLEYMLLCKNFIYHRSSIAALFLPEQLYRIPDSELRKMSQIFADNNNCFNVVNNIPDDESKIHAWLSPLDPRIRHQDIRSQRMDNVGSWLLETGEFRSWHSGSGGDESDHGILFCMGNPGVGKSYIT